MKTDFDAIMQQATLQVNARWAHILAQHESVYPCGVSYLTFKDVRTPFIKYLKKNGLGHPGVDRGWVLSSSEFMPTDSQNMFVREEVCSIAREVFGEHGIECHVRTRID